MPFIRALALTVFGGVGAMTPAARGDAPDPDAAANAFFERAFQERLALDPALATALGLRLRYGEWPDPSDKGDLERFELAKRQLAELHAGIDPARLNEATRPSYPVFESGEDAAIKAIERYILNPGQAIAYMIGMLKIVELRERAAASPGRDFGSREFHDPVMRTGGVPLTVRESEVQRWIEARRD